MTRCGRCRRCECAGAPTTTSHGDVRNRDNDAPDAVLEGLAMTGLVDILRQLGDLAECVCFGVPTPLPSVSY